MSKIRHAPAVLAALLIALAAGPGASRAQLGDLVGKAKKKVEKKVDKTTDDALDQALEGKPKSGSKTPAAAAASGSSSGRPGQGVWVNYDFVPGSRVIFFEDFADEEVGNFPRRLEFQKGNMEVAEWEGRRWLRASTPSEFVVRLPEAMPDRFTLEFEYLAAGNSLGAILRFDDIARSQTYVEFRSFLAGIKGGGLSATTRTDDPLRKTQPFHCRILADGQYVKVYSNEVRVANVPNAAIGRSKFVRISLPGTASNPVMMTALRIAESNRRIYDELSAKGRVAVNGILFDTDSDAIRPESTPTLKEIGTMLDQHPELELVIEGHTDDQGDATHNQRLSEQRAQAVRAYLVERHGVAEGRLDAKGLGESQPKAPNATPEGRQTNRRVELAVRSEG